MKKIYYMSVCLLSLALGSCTKNKITQVGNLATGAQLKFVQGVAGLPPVDEFINNTKISPIQNFSVTDNARPTAIVTGIAYLKAFDTALQYPTMFPGGSSTNYAAVPSGSTTIKIAASVSVPALVSAQTVAPNATVATVTQNLTDRAAYTLFTMGFPDKVTTLVTQDKFAGTDTTKAYVRFANLIPNAPASIDLRGTFTVSGTTTTNSVLFTNVPYGTVTEFMPMSVTSLGSTGYVFSMVQTGTTTAVGAAAKSIPLGANRYYTILATGLGANYVVPNTSITLRSTARPTAPTDPNSLLPEIYFNPPGISYYVSK